MEKVRTLLRTRAEMLTSLLRRGAMPYVVIGIVLLLGLSGIAVAAAGIAKILFYIFLIVFVVTLLLGLSRRSRV